MNALSTNIERTETEREETISEGLKRLGYTHRKVPGSDEYQPHIIEKDGVIVGHMHADEAAALIKREDAERAA